MIKIKAFSFLAMLFLVAAPCGGASAGNSGGLSLEGRFSQGGMVLGQTLPGAIVSLDGREIRVGPEGRFVFGFGRDAETRASLKVVLPDGEQEVRDIVILKRDYDVQRIDGLPSKMVSPPAEVLARIARENRLVAEVRRLDTENVWYAGTFIWPAKGKMTGVYGSQRVLNGEPKRPHFGLDVAAPVGTPVVAPATGKVMMAEDNLYYTGGTVMLDHGHGVTSVLMHLSAVEVTLGQTVRQGEQIGRMGATGRATGSHVDWRVNWFDVRLDPQFLVEGLPAPLD